MKNENKSMETDASASEWSDLLPCPYCGEKPEIEKYSDEYDDNTTRISCKNEDCIGSHCWQDDEETAIKTWNTRAR